MKAVTMRTDELKRRLGDILAIEEAAIEPDWDAIAALSNHLISETTAALSEIAEAYLSGFNHRRTDGVFAHAQRAELLGYLRAP
jgi:hypothetical protein